MTDNNITFEQLYGKSISELTVAELIVVAKSGVPPGYCQCGCGQKTRLAPQTDLSKGWINGEPVRYIQGHSSRGEGNPKWRGGITTDEHGYVMIKSVGHPRANMNNYVREHILIAEKVLGKHLPKDAVVHHHDGINSNNAHNNLVICQDENYHKLLHLRQRAYKACGHANWRKCKICKEYDSITNMIPKLDTSGYAESYYHQVCNTNYARTMRKARKIKRYQT